MAGLQKAKETKRINHKIKHRKSKVRDYMKQVTEMKDELSKS